VTEIVLRELAVGDELAFRAAVREFAAVDPDWELAFDFDEDTIFARYLERLERDKHSPREGRVRHTYLIATAGDAIIGRVSLRHTLNERLRECGGHLGFGVVPSHRRKGYGTQMLRQSLPIARALGIDRVLLTCDDRNLGSIRIIESCGGVFEDTRPRAEGGITRRYWIQLGSQQRADSPP
jgi:predicted acetyltransferase